MRSVAAMWDEYAAALRGFTRPVRLYFVSEFMVWFSRGVQLVLFNLYLGESGFPPAFVGRAVALAGIGLAASALPAGWLADRWGCRRTLMLGAFIEGLGIVLRSTVPHPGAIGAACVLTGSGMALFQVGSIPFLTGHSSPGERTHLFGAYFAMSLVAGVAGNIAGGALPSLVAALGGVTSTALAYRVVLVAAGTVAIAAMLPLASRTAVPKHVTTSAHEPQPGSSRLLAPVAINFLILGFGAGLVIPFMNVYFKQRFDCTSAEIGTYFSIAAVATAIAALASPVVGRRFGSLPTALGMQVLSLPFLLTLGGDTGLAIAVAAFWARATLMQASNPLLQGFVMETLPPSLHARSSSLNNMLFSMGGSLSAAIAGYLIQYGGFGLSFRLTATIYALGAIQLFVASRRFPGRTAPATVVLRLDT